MEKKLIYAETVIDRLFDSVELDTFFVNVNRVREKLLQEFPEIANHKMQLAFYEDKNYDIVVSLTYYRYETDAEYQTRITNPERERQDRLAKLYAQIDQDKEETINYLKAIGAI